MQYLDIDDLMVPRRPPNNQHELFVYNFYSKTTEIPDLNWISNTEAQPFQEFLPPRISGSPTTVQGNLKRKEHWSQQGGRLSLICSIRPASVRLSTSAQGITTGPQSDSHRSTESRHGTFRPKYSNWNEYSENHSGQNSLKLFQGI